MTALPPEAYAIVEGRHPDPFHYLGLHAEDDGPVVRVFLPDAADVAVIDERGHIVRHRAANIVFYTTQKAFAVGNALVLTG